MYSTYATTSFITKPTLPQNLASNSASNTPTTVVLSWTALATGVGYNVQYCTGECTSQTQESATTPIDRWKTGITTFAPTHEVTGLTPNTQYSFRVQAQKTLTTPSDTQTSNWTTPITATPTFNAPQNFAISAQTATSISVSWDQDAKATGGYNIQYCHSGTCDGSEGTSSTSTDANKWITGTDPASSATSQAVSSLTSGTTYKFRMRSVQSSPSANSKWTSILTSTTKPVAPSSLAISNQATTTATLTWTAPTGVNQNYDIEYCSNLSNCSITTGLQGSWTSPSTTSATSGLSSKPLTGLTSATQYNLRIRATRTEGSTTVKSAWAGVSFTTKPETVPNSNFRTTANTLTTVTVNWTAVARATGYHIQYCKVSDSNCGANGAGTAWASISTDPTNANATSGTVASTTTSKEVTSLTTNAEYRFRVRAQKTISNPTDTQVSNWSNTVNATPLFSPPASPSVSAQTSTTATLSWTNNADATSGYEIHYCTGTCTAQTTTSTTPTDTSKWIDLSTNDASAGASSKTISSLSSNTNYKFRIRSLRPANVVSPWSAIVSGTTAIAPPSGLSISSYTATSAILSWTAPTGLAGTYDIQYCSTLANCAITPDASLQGGWTASNITGIAQSRTSYNIPTTSAGTQYNLRIRATGSSSVKSNWAGFSFITPTAVPQNFALNSRTSTELTLNWTAVTGANGGYVIEYCQNHATNCTSSGSGSSWGTTGTGATAGTIEKTSQSDSSHALSSLTTDALYNLRIRTKITGTPNSVVAYSAWAYLQAQPTADPAPPTSPQASTPITTSKIPVSWTAPSTVPTGGYQVQHCENNSSSCTSSGGGADWDSATPKNVTSGTSTTISSLTAGTKYNIRVRSVKTSTPNAYSVWTTPIQADTVLTAPNAPTVAQGVGKRRINCIVDCGNGSNKLQLKSVRRCCGLFSKFKLGNIHK